MLHKRINIQRCFIQSFVKICKDFRRLLIFQFVTALNSQNFRKRTKTFGTYLTELSNVCYSQVEIDNGVRLKF